MSPGYFPGLIFYWAHLAQLGHFFCFQSRVGLFFVEKQANCW